MDTPKQVRYSLLTTLPSLRVTASFLLITGGVVFAGTLCGSGSYRSAAAVVAAALGTATLVYAPLSVERVLIVWFALTPLASFYVRFPTDRSIITFNRAFFAALVLALLLRRERGAARVSARFSMIRFEAAWTTLAVLALLSAFASANNVAYATRIAIDTFWLPLAAFYIARNYVDLRRDAGLWLLAAIALALFLFAIGAFEFATGRDLLAYKGAEIVREGERRVNGPFASDSSFAIACAMLFVFLQAAPRLLRMRFDRTGRLAYVSAVVAAMLGALLPLFRAVGIALVLCWTFLQWSTSRGNGPSSSRATGGRRLISIGSLLLVVLIAVAGWVATIAPSMFGSRLTTPRTAFGRLATWEAAAQITFDNPIFGVGLGNYAEYFDQTHYYADEPVEEVLETKAVNGPHSNLLWISSELGVTGLAMYIAANIYLLLMGWRAFKRSRDGRQRAAASCFLALIAAYWIPGLTLASAYYSDLNLFFFFLLGALSSGFLASGKSVVETDV